MNLILMTDSYKASHFLQYPPGTSYMYSYLEARGGEYPDTVFFGLQYLLNEYLTKRITIPDVETAASFFEAHGEPFPYLQWARVIEKHDGFIPLRIRAVPEGSVIPNHNILLDAESTDPELFWMVTWFETMLMRLWYPITVATQSYFCKKTILNFLQNTSDDPAAEIDFKLHDFGARGVSSHESAAIGGAAHLVNFMGSDTVEGIAMANKVYHSDMAGFSIPAAEHSTITAWGKSHEADAFRNMLTQFGGKYPLVAVVSDSYDIYNAVSHLWGETLRDLVVESGSILVVRPDSGNPPMVVKEVLERLDAKFGHTINSKGYRVLNNVRVIQGDGINRDSIYEILSMATNAGYSASNVAFGMGGALLQQVNRDTQKFAYKCAEVEVEGVRRMVWKQPVTDLGKKSKAGRMDLVKQGNLYQTVTYGHPNTILEKVYENGRMYRSQTLSDIRSRAWPLN